MKDELFERKEGDSDLESELKKLYQEMQVQFRKEPKEATNEGLSRYLNTLENVAYYGKKTFSSQEIKSFKIVFVKSTVSPLVCLVTWT